MKHYKAVIIGASAKGIGIASQFPGEVLILEPSSLVGREFIDALEPGSLDWQAQTKPGKALKEAYTRKKILMEDKPIQIAAAAPVLFQFVKDQGIRICFATRVSSHGDSGEITYYNTSGAFTVTADHIYSWETEAAGQEGCGKYLNALLYQKNPDRCPDWENGKEGIWITEYSHEDMKVLSCALKEEDGWIQARERMHRFWQENPQMQCGWRLSLVASTFSWKIRDNKSKEPVPLYGNMLKAFESGVQLGAEWRDENAV